MYKNFKYLFSISIISILFFTSCSKTNKEGRYIPLGASVVLHLNGQSLSSKLPWEEIRNSGLVKVTYDDSSTSPIIRSWLDNPENSGIDLKKDLFFFVVKDTAGDYMAFEGSLKDEAAFRKFNRDAGKQAPVESEKNGLSFSSHSNMAAAWNKEKFVLIAESNYQNTANEWMNRKGQPGDSSAAINSGHQPDKLLTAESIFNLKESNSLGKDEKFTDLMSHSADVHFWVNTEALASGSSGMPGMAALSLINLRKIYEGSRLTGTVNFEDGKMNVDIKTFSGKEMKDLVKKYSGENINMEMIRRLPSKNVAALFAFNFKPEGLREYLKLLGVEGFANMGNAYLGFNMDDFIKANKGDIQIAVSDLSQDSLGKPGFAAIFSTSIGDKSSFNKLITAGNKLGKEKLGGISSPSIFYNMNENYFAIGNHKEQVDAYINASGSSEFDFVKTFSGSSTGAYINFQYIIKSLGPKTEKDSLKLALYDASLKMWDNLIAWGGGFESGGNIQHIEINLVDKKTNSLKQMNKYLFTLGMIKKKQDELYSFKTGNEPMIGDTASLHPEL